MKLKILHPAIFPVFVVFVLAGCLTPTSPNPIQESEAAASPFVAPFLPTQTPNLPSTNTPEPTQTPTPSPSPTPSPTPTQAVSSEIIRRLCPSLKPPVGLFSVPEPLFDERTDPATIYAPYQVLELGPDSSGGSCTLYLSPPPMGAPQFAGDNLFWKNYDDENEWAMVWKYDLNDVLTDEVLPQHTFLRQTRTHTTIGKAGLFDFVAAEDGETLVWSFTDPQPYDQNEIGYVQTMLGAATSGPIDQRPPADVWFDFVPEGDYGANIIRPRKISPDGKFVYYSQEPVGLGRQWPEPLGQYTSLYSISTWGDAYPELHFDCGSNLWCLSDFSEAHGILVSINEDALQIRALENGRLIREIQTPEAFPLARQALIGPDGTIAFLGVVLGEGGSGDPPEDAAIFLIAPPYQEDPVLVMRDAGLLNLLGWASPDLLLANGNNLADNAAGRSTLPAHLMLVDLETRAGTWLPFDAAQFVTLID